jgi:hypothetical protein
MIGYRPFAMGLKTETRMAPVKQDTSSIFRPADSKQRAKPRPEKPAFPPFRQRCLAHNSPSDILTVTRITHSSLFVSSEEPTKYATSTAPCAPECYCRSCVSKPRFLSKPLSRESGSADRCGNLGQLGSDDQPTMCSELVKCCRFLTNLSSEGLYG